MILRIWHAHALAAELRAGALSEGQKAGYLLALVVVQAGMDALSGGSAGLFGAGPNRLLHAAMAATVGAAGIAACFRANQRGDGARFVERFVCLFLPVMVRWYVLYLCVYYALYYAGGLAGWWTPASYAGSAGGVQLWTYLLMQGVFFAMLRRYVALASSRAVD